MFSNNQLVNADIKPERQKELELGTDLSFFDNRLGLQFNYYIKKVNDLLISRVISPTEGYASYLNNLGSLRNKGFEIVLTGSPVKNKEWRWDITGIYNHNRNEALKIGQALTLLSTNAGAPVAILEGEPIGVFYGTFLPGMPMAMRSKIQQAFPKWKKAYKTVPWVIPPKRCQWPACRRHPKESSGQSQSRLYRLPCQRSEL